MLVGYILYLFMSIIYIFVRRSQSKSYLFIAYIKPFYVILNLICRTRCIRIFIYGFRMYMRYVSIVATKAFTWLYIAMNPAVRKFFTDVLFHSAYNKLMLHPKMGKQRNHGSTVIHRWPPPVTHRATRAHFTITLTMTSRILVITIPYTAIDTSIRCPLI